jgi:putative membrane protein
MRTYDVPLDPPQHSVLAAWTLDPATTALLVLLVVGVLVGARRCPTWSRGRLVPLVLGVATTVVAVDAWPGVYARGLISVLVSQQLTLLLVSPVLLAFARPSEPLRALGLRLPGPLRAAGEGLGHPMLGPVLVPVVSGALVFTPLLHLAVTDQAAADALHVALLVIGAIVAAPLAREDTAGTSLGVGLVLFVGLIELLVDAVPGIALRLTNTLQQPVLTLAARRSWGPSPLHDQQLAGGILWAVAEIIDVPYLLIVLRQWIRADAREAHRVDADLDRAALERRLRTPVSLNEEPPPDRERPWWETDASVFGEARAGRLRRRE